MARFHPYTKQFLLAHEPVHSTARFQSAEPTSKMAAKLGLALFLELISVSESAEKRGLRDVSLMLSDEFCCSFVPCYHKSFTAATRLRYRRHWTS